MFKKIACLQEMQNSDAENDATNVAETWCRQNDAEK